MGSTILVFVTCLLFASSSSSSLSYHLQDLALSASRKDEHKAPEIHCSRERSRLASRAIDEYLVPFVEREKYQLPIQCRLHPLNNLFRDHEEHKIHMDLNDWRCGYCKKTFRAERFLDQHFDNRHNNLLNVSHGKCLADLCGALHCDLMMETKVPKTKCNPAAVTKNRHMCEEIADSCFPLNQGRSATRLHELFLRQFCDAHACSGGKKPFSRGGKKKTNLFYLSIAILTLLLLPLFYILVYLYQRDLRNDTQKMKRIVKQGAKPKPKPH